MNLIFIFERISDNKWYAPLVQKALDLGVSVEIWLNQKDISQSTKWYEVPHQEKMPLFGGNERICYKAFHSQESFRQLVATATKQSLIISGTPNPFADLKNNKWVHLICSLYDSISRYHANNLNKFDYIFFATEFWKNAAIEYYETTKQFEADAALKQSILAKSFVTGSAQYDHFLMGNKSTWREKLNLPKNKKILLVFAFESPASFWPSRIFKTHSKLLRIFYVLALPLSMPYIFSKIGARKAWALLLTTMGSRLLFFKEALFCKSEQEVYEAIHAFCLKNDLFFALKARRKKDLAEYETKYADLVVSEDNEYYPYHSAQLLMAADITLTMFSSAAVESVAANVPVINLAPSNIRYYVRDHFVAFKKCLAKEFGIAEESIFYNTKEEGVFNFRSMVKSYSVNEFVSIANSSNELLATPLREDQYQYRKKFASENENDAASNIIKHLKVLYAQG